jgi:hypothetical protein
MILSPQLTSIKQELEVAGTVLGLFTSVFAGVRAAVNTISNHTLSRKRRKASEDVNTYLQLLRTFADKGGDRWDVGNLSVYQNELTHNLKGSLAALESAQQEEAKRTAKRFEGKVGWKKWLILYSPLSADGLLTQSCFFGLIAAMVVIAFRWVHQASSWGDPVGIGFAALAIGSYLSQAADRIRSVSVFERRLQSSLPDVLSPLNRNLLWFHLETGDAFLDRLFYYAAGLFFLMVVIVFSFLAPDVTRWDVIKAVAFLIAAAIVIRVSRASALASRKLDLLTTAFKSEEDGGGLREVPIPKQSPVP